jgi:hypothetical protein
MTKKTDAAPEPIYIRRVDAERLLAETATRIAEIERDLIERILTRIAAGDNSQTANTEEIQRALAQLNAASAALAKAMDALPNYPNPAVK